MGMLVLKKLPGYGRVFSCFLFLEEMGGKGGAVLGGGVFNASFMFAVS